MAVGTYLKAALSISIFLVAIGGAAASAPTQAQPDFPADGAMIPGDIDGDNIWTKRIFIPGATAVEHTGYFSDNYDDVANRIEDANLGHPPYATVPGWEYTLFAGNPQVPPANETLVRSTKYYWTVDATDALGNTFSGDIWEFTVQGWKAFEPSPPNEAVDVETNVLLSWLPGHKACEHDVFIGTSWENVNNARYNYSNQPPEFLGTTTEPNILVTGLAHGVKYYWRVDEIYGCMPPPFLSVNVGMYDYGDVWSFTTAGGEAQCDFPADGAVITGNTEYSGDVYIWTKLIFIPGATAVEHTGYFSDDYSKVENRAQDANLGHPPYGSIPGWEYTFFAGYPAVPPADDSLVRGTVYYWTVDETDAEGNTYPGEIWEFTILGFYASAPSPPNEAVDVETIVLFSWLPGFGARCHAVHLGTSWDDVNNAVYDPFNPPPEFLVVTTEPNILVTGLSFNTKYYWRVDEPAGRSCCLPPPFPPFCGMYYKGDVWCFTTAPNRIYVDIDAAGANDGASWENAYNFLQDALADADSSEKPVEMRVAGGIYTPDSNSADPNGSGSRTATFRLINGVTIKGGYAGFGQPNPDARDIELYETILSGDLDGNDVDVNDPADLLDEPTRAENSYHVVIGSGTDANAILDGFTITGGNAKIHQYQRGGGIYNESGSPTLTNCTFTANSAITGGGMSNGSGSPRLTNCTFAANWAMSGGGISNGSGSPKLTKCKFVGNNSSWQGGGIYNAGSISVMSCIFIGNTAQTGGGIFNEYYTPSSVLINCIFVGNSVTASGGGIFNGLSDLAVTNCTFVGNSAEDRGGGFYIPPLPVPSVSSSSTAYDGYSILTNCIFRDNVPEQIVNRGGDISVVYSDVQGGWGGVGNINADPCFVDGSGGDLRLSWDSPCIDTGDNNAPNLPPTDFDGHPRIIVGDCNDTEVVDMGAFEFNYAYMGDFDYNCGVNFADLSIFGLAWTSQPGDFNWDFACNISIPADNVIDKLDLAAFADNWLAGF